MEAIITVVGFLGAGKTTLLKYLLEHFSYKGWQPFVILNDYENATMDAQQFAKQIGFNCIKPLSGSCICCSGIVELRNTVNRITPREKGITLIEANGTSDACSLMEFLSVGLHERFLPPIQISVVDVKNWQQRGEHNELEANQIQVSSLLVLTHL
jgi:G3E family GTPase